MKMMNNYEQLISKYYTDCEGNPQSVHIIKKYQISPSGGDVVLDGIPDMNNSIEIKDDTGNILKRVWNLDEVGLNTFYVWSNGRVSLDPSRSGDLVIIDFYSIGLELIGADRVFTELDDKGNVVESLGDILEKSKEYIKELDFMGGIVDGNKILNTTIENAKSEDNTLNATINEAKSKDSILDATIENAKTEDGTLNTTIVNAKAEDSVLNATINNAKAEDNTLKNTINSVEENNQTLNTTIENAKAEDSVLNATINEAKSEDGVLNITINNAKLEDGILNTTINNAKAEDNNLTQSINEAQSIEANINSLKDNISIGGDNFITNGMLEDSSPNSLYIRDWNYWGDTSTISIFSNPDYNATGCVYFAGTGTGGVYQDIDIRNFNAGEQYVASFDYFKQTNVKGIEAYIETYDGNGVKLPDGCLLSRGTTTANDTYCICPFTIPTNKNITHIRLSFSFGGATDFNGSLIQLGNIKISSGTVPTKGNTFSKGDLDGMINPLRRKVEYSGTTFISGANANIEVHTNHVYAVNGSNQVEITSINHTSMDNGDKCYFLVASGDENSKITFRSENLKASNVFLTGGKDQVFNGKDNGDLIITLYKSGDSARLTYDSQFGGLKDRVESLWDSHTRDITRTNNNVKENTNKINSITEDVNNLGIGNLIRNTNFLAVKGGTNIIPKWSTYGNIQVYTRFGQEGYDELNTIYLANIPNSENSEAGIYQELSENLKMNTEYTLSFNGYRELNVKSYNVAVEFVGSNGANVDKQYIVQGAVNTEIQTFSKKFTTPSTEYVSTRVRIEHCGLVDVATSARYLIVMQDLKLVEGRIETGYTPFLGGIATLEEAMAWTDGSYMKLKRDGFGFITITGYKRVTPNPKGTWNRITFPFSLKDANYSVQVTAFDGRSDNNFRSCKVGDTLTKDWVEVLAGDIFGFYYTIVSSECY